MLRIQLRRFRPHVLQLFWSIAFVLAWSLVATTPVAADQVGSKHVAVLGARTDLFGFFGSSVPAVPGITIERISTSDLTPSRLGAFDTLAILEICKVDPPLTEVQHQAIVDWIEEGGKAIVWDSDRCVPGPQYSWLPAPFTADTPGARGDHSGKISIVANSPLGSTDSASPYYLDTGALERDSDSGDTNVVLSKAPQWCEVAETRNLDGQTGASEAYAYIGHGVLLYSGYDLDFLSSSPQVSRIWQLQLGLTWDRVNGIPNPGLSPAPGCKLVSAPNPTTNFEKALPALGGSIVGAFLSIVPFLVVLLPFLIVGRRNELVLFIREAVRWLAAPALFPVLALGPFIEAAAAQVAKALKGVAYTSKHNDHDLSRWIVWDLVSPLIYLGEFILIALADLYVAAQKFHQLIFGESGSPGVDLGLLTGVVYVLIGVVFVEVGLELAGIMPVGRPFHNFPETLRRRFAYACLVGFVLTIVDYILFNFWAQMQVVGSASDPWLNANLPLIIMPLLGVLLLAATGLSGWALWVGSGVLVAIALVIAFVGLLIVWSILTIAVWAFEQGRRALTALVDIIAWFPRAIHNASFDDGEEKQKTIFGWWKRKFHWVKPDPIDIDLDKGFPLRIFKLLGTILLNAADSDQSLHPRLSSLSSVSMPSDGEGEETEVLQTEPTHEPTLNGNQELTKTA